MEDQLLRSRVEQSHSESWSKIAEGVPGRSYVQTTDTRHVCMSTMSHRMYWCVDPSLIKSAFTTDEEIALENAYEELGNRWTEIAKRLPGRSEHDVKLRWKTMHPHRLDRSKATTRSAPTPPPPRRVVEMPMTRPRQMSNVMGSDVISMLDELAVDESTAAPSKRPHVTDWDYTAPPPTTAARPLAGSFQLTDSFLNTLRKYEHNPTVDEEALIDSLFASFGPHDEEAIRRSFNISMQEFDAMLENKTTLKKSLTKLSSTTSNTSNAGLSFLNNTSFLNNDDIDGLISSCVDNQIDHLAQ
ncbi:hypothetical protein AaE_010565 [Aphanomyces astaci]|uniref:Myb-like domain-containing protein n=1 Tax=Aphanomyces astaci TaxID=112090 RepID=A0A6A5A0G5_APHAT|nr:hypothetical protein AaE_010565 [Aphanomyces astaci]